MDKETNRTLGRLAEWFGMMGFADALDAMVAECLEYGNEMYVKRTKRMPAGADRFRMQRCWSPSRFLEHGYRRFIERSLREEFGFEGSPIQISVNIREKKKRK